MNTKLNEYQGEFSILDEVIDEKESSYKDKIIKEGLSHEEFIDEAVVVSGNPLTEN